MNVYAVLRRFIILVSWLLFSVSSSQVEETQKKPRLFYMNDLCTKKQGVAINGRKAIRMAPWNPPSQVKPTQQCIVPVWSYKYQNFKLTTAFKNMDMRKPSSSGFCSTARLDLYNGNTTSPAARLTGPEGLCGKNAVKEYYSTTRNIMTMEFNTYNDFNRYEYFEAVVTPFHEGRCADDEFRCKNGRCVFHELLCDSYNNCGDNSDESDCKKLLLSIAAIIGIVVGCVVLIGIIVTVVICKCCCAVCGYERI